MNGADSRQWHRDRWRNAVFSDGRVSPMARLVASIIKEYAGATKSVELSLGRLETESNAARATVRRGLRQLLELGWLVELEPAAGRRPATWELVIQEASDRPVGGAELDPEPSRRGVRSEPLRSRRGVRSEPLGAVVGVQSEAVGVQSEAVEVQSEARRGIATIPNQESIDINQSTRARTSELARLCGLKDDDEKMKMIEEDLHRRDVVDFVAYVRGIVENGTLADYLAGLDSRVRDVPELPTWRDDTPRPNNPADVRLRAAHGAGQHADGHYPQCSLCRAEAQE